MAFPAVPRAEQHGRELLLSHSDPALARDGPPAALCRRHAPSHATTAHCPGTWKGHPVRSFLRAAWAPGRAGSRFVQCMQGGNENVAGFSLCTEDDCVLQSPSWRWAMGPQTSHPPLQLSHQATMSWRWGLCWVCPNTYYLLCRTLLGDLQQTSSSRTYSIGQVAQSGLGQQYYANAGQCHSHCSRWPAQATPE